MGRCGWLASWGFLVCEVRRAMVIGGVVRRSGV